MNSKDYKTAEKLSKHSIEMLITLSDALSHSISRHYLLFGRLDDDLSQKMLHSFKIIEIAISYKKLI